jgi:hypothetical protein
VAESNELRMQLSEEQLRERLKRMLSERLEPLVSELTTVKSTINEVFEQLVTQARSPVESEIDEVANHVRQTLADADASHQTVADELREQIAARDSQLSAQYELLAQATARTADIAAINEATAEIERHETQADVLTALLEQTTRFASRAQLFVLRKDELTSWKSRGFDDPGEAGAELYNVIKSREPATTANEDGLDSVAIPLVVRDKAVALLFADNQPSGKIETRPLEVLMRVTALVIERLALRREVIEAGLNGMPQSAPMAFTQDYLHEAPPTDTSPLPMPLFEAASQRELTAEEKAAAHSNARRFARFLVSEIKVYNSTRVQEGTRRLDLYDRLKDEIEVRREVYDRHVDQKITNEFDYFNDELVKILAEGDEARLGRR